MTKPVRYQEGYLFVDHGAWFVRYRERARQEDGSIKLNQKARKLGTLKSYPRESNIKPLLREFMQRLNAGKFTPEASMTLREFVECFYLVFVEDEMRASTDKGYRESGSHIRDRVGEIRVREFRTSMPAKW
jgi:hypothetical protein